jgi:hypothetical protein
MSENPIVDQIVENVPEVINESDFSKNNKMILTLTIISIIIWYIFENTKNNICLVSSNKYNEYMTDTSNTKIDETKSIIGYYIQISHNNKKVLPINKIIIIDSNRNIIPIYTKNAKKLDNGKNGVILEYKLINPTNISQIIVDVNMLDIQSKNIVNAVVKIINKENKTMWINTGILHLSKLIEINVNDPSYIYPTHQEKLNHRHNSDEHEFVLKNKLIENTWI